MSLPDLLSRLEAVKRTGHGRFVARCPAHLDARPSLSIRELPDGRTLVNCFAGCPIEEVLEAVGLDFSALFPEQRIGDHLPRLRAPFAAADVLACLASEALTMFLFASALARGETLSDTERARLILATARLGKGAGLANGER